MDISRRKFIKQLSLLTATAAYTKLFGFPAMASEEEIAAGLAETARNAGIEFGCCINPHLLKNNQHYIDAIKKDCTILVAENAMKWKNLNPSPGIYDYSKADEIMDFAATNDMKTRFHALIWHKSYPNWVKEKATGEAETERILRDYADNILRRYKGKMRSWDIVNEPIRIKDFRAGGMRSSLWYNALGSDYVAKCFNIAKEYDLGGDLVLNEYGLETGNYKSKFKRRALLNLVRDLKDRDVPIDAVGLQSHLIAHMTLADKEEYQTWLQDLKDTDVKIYITELDIDERKIKGDARTRALTAAVYVEEYLRRIYEVTTPKELLTWGIWDGSTFMNWKKPPDEKHAQPLLYAKNWQKNPLWYTLEQTLESFSKQPE